MKIRFLLIGMLVLISTFTFSQDKTRSERRSERLKTQKIAFITSKLDLNVEESEKFWPIYNKYQENLKTLRDEGKGTKPSSEMTDEEANAFINNVLQYEEKSLMLKQKFINDVKKVIPMTKVAKLEILENEFKRHMLDRIKERYKERGPRKEDRK